MTLVAVTTHAPRLAQCSVSLCWSYYSVPPFLEHHSLFPSIFGQNWSASCIHYFLCRKSTIYSVLLLSLVFITSSGVFITSSCIHYFLKRRQFTAFYFCIYTVLLLYLFVFIHFQRPQCTRFYFCTCLYLLLHFQRPQFTRFYFCLLYHYVLSQFDCGQHFTVFSILFYFNNQIELTSKTIRMLELV